MSVVIISLLNGVGQIRNRAAAFEHAFSCGDGCDRAAPPKFLDTFCAMSLEIPVRRVQRLPDSVEIRMPANARCPLGCLYAGLLARLSCGRRCRSLLGPCGANCQHY